MSELQIFMWNRAALRELALGFGELDSWLIEGLEGQQWFFDKMVDEIEQWIVRSQ